MREYRARIVREEEQVNNMDISKIYKISTAKFFDNIEYFRELNNVLINLCKEVFTNSYNSGGKEAGAILNLRTLEYGVKKPKYFDRINFCDCDDECKRIDKQSGNNECVTIHTHNSVSTFSLVDLTTLLTSESTLAMVVVDSDANIHIMIKDANRDYTKFLAKISEYSWTDIIYPEIYNMYTSENIIYRRLTNES